MSRKKFIPPSKTAAVVKTKRRVKAEALKEEAPADLKGLWASVKLQAATHTLLQKGAFTFDMRNTLEACLNYASECHKHLLEQCEAHPKKDLIPELVTLLAAQKVADGQTNTDATN